MLKAIVVSAFLTTAATASAGQHYVEVWNPPEAHGSTSSSVGREHKSSNKRVAPLKPAIGRAKPHVAMKSVAVPVPPPQGTERRVPTFDDIPRKRTPRGDVLRVHGDAKQVRVER